jgi:hypothetical protein
LQVQIEFEKPVDWSARHEDSCGIAAPPRGKRSAWNGNQQPHYTAENQYTFCPKLAFKTVKFNILQTQKHVYMRRSKKDVLLSIKYTILQTSTDILANIVLQ